MTYKEKQTTILVLIIAVVAALIVGVFMFMGMLKEGSLDDLTQEKIAVGENHMLVVDDSGVVYAWGHNALGELGNVTCDNSDSPVKIEVPGKVVQVAAGEELSFALCKNGDLYAWGDDTSWQMGDGMNVSRMEPEKVMEDVVKIAAGSKHALAIKKDGGVYVWGRNKNGALGIEDSACDQKDEDDIACLSQPVKVLDDGVDISAGMDYSMAVTSDGTLYAWGDDIEGQLGLEKADSQSDSTGHPYQSKPAKVMDNVKSISCGARYQSFAITNDGDLYGWGKNSVGSVGIEKVNDTENNIQRTPVKVMSDVAQVATGSAHTIALKNDGTAYAWGVNNYHQISIKNGDKTYDIGEETIYYQSTPKKIGKDISAVAAGGFSSALYTNSDVLKTFGGNLYGQLGLGKSDSSVITPTAVLLK